MTKATKEYLEKLDLQIQEAQKELAFENAYNAYMCGFFIFGISFCVFIFACIIFCFKRELALRMLKEIKQECYVYLFDFYRDKALRASIKFYKITKKKLLAENA